MLKEELVFGFHAVNAVLQQSPHRVLQLYTQKEREDQQLKKVIELATDQGIAHQVLLRAKLDAMVPDCRHQGVVARCRVVLTHTENDLEKLLNELTTPAFLLILDGVQDPHNLGACLRSANAAGVHAVIAPHDRSVGLTPVARKVACGAAESTPFIQVTNLARTLEWLKERGVWLYGTADDAKKSLFQMDLRGPIALVLGAEEKGLRRLTRETCDEMLFIPMAGSVSSLNVSVATGVCLFEVVRQRQ
jgi:23S rRNA (guanosine2251-2'-O)-methyltransferase